MNIPVLFQLGSSGGDAMLKTVVDETI